MKSSHNFKWMQIAFDDDNLVANAGVKDMSFVYSFLAAGAGISSGANQIASLASTACRIKALRKSNGS